MKITWIGFVILVCSLLLAKSAIADVWDKLNSSEYQLNEGVEEYVWKEGESSLPDYPREQDLVDIAGPANYANYRYRIDTKTLTVGVDGVIRYSLLIHSSSGVDNVFYDGIRCNSNQLKNYAYGSTNKQGEKVFVAKKNTSWQAFKSRGVMAYGPVLVKNYFCNYDGALLKRHEIIQNIKYGKGEVDGLYN